MKKLLDSKLFSLAKESMQKEIAPLDMDKAYNEFAFKVHQKGKSKDDLFFFYYQLGYSLLEIKELISVLKKKWSKPLFR